eukprot:12625300-Alexandrium_andersonii.AAC.1
MFTDKLCNEGAHNYACLLADRWLHRFNERISMERYGQAHVRVFRSLSGVHRRRPARLDLGEVLNNPDQVAELRSAEAAVTFASCCPGG